MKKIPILKSPTLRKGLFLFLFAGLGSSLAGQHTVLDNEGLAHSPGHFPAFDGWQIHQNDRAKVVVQDYGLTYDVADGRRIEGGIRSILLNGASDAKMNRWLELPIDAPTETTYFSLVFRPHTLGTDADPDQLFVRFGGWSAFTAVKIRENQLEINGETTALVPGSDLEDRQELAGQNHLLVGELRVENGTVNRFRVWLNPSAEDADSPTHSEDINVAASNLTVMDLRSQNTATTIDNIRIGTSFSDVVPPMPEDPGDITLTLPNDGNPEQPGIQITGGTLFVEVDGQTYEADTVLPVGTQVTYRVVPEGDHELIRWNNTTETGTEITVPVYGPTNISPVLEFGDFRVNLIHAHGARPRIQLQRADGGWGNTTRTLFDTGEVIRVVADGLPFFTFDHFRGDLAPLNTGLDPANPNRISPALTVGVGLLTGDSIDVEATAYFDVRDYAVFDTVPGIGLEQVAYDFTEAGAHGTLPAAEINRIAEEKFAAGLGGSVDFTYPLEFSGLLVDPTVDLSSPQPPGFIRYDYMGNVVGFNLPAFLHMNVVIGDRAIPIRVSQGPRHYVEAGGSGNLATADGPGPQISFPEGVTYRGEYFRPFHVAVNAGGRVPTSGPVSLSSGSSWDLEFDADDKVVVAGLAYLSRTDWQFYNVDRNVRLWADAVYDDGSSSQLLSSPNMHNVAGDHNHFAGFYAPEGRYITNLRVWFQGGNNRAFTNIDDLVIIVEGDADATYMVNVDAQGGDVTVSDGPYREGQTVTLQADRADPGYAFIGWAYASDPDRVISTATTLELTVRSNIDVVAVFEEAPPAEPSLVLDNERLSPGHFPAFDGWEIDVADRAKVVVQDHGLHYDIEGGRRIEGGQRSLLLQGGVEDSMDAWLTLPIMPMETGMAGSLFFSTAFQAETIGTSADPAELFIRFDGWAAYAAVNLHAGEIELPGGNRLSIAEEGTVGLAGVTHLVVGELVYDAEGVASRMNLWLNPDARDRTPMLSADLAGNTNIGDIDSIEVRSQKVPMVIDNFTIGSAWQDVVPLMPEDPGDITLTLPADASPEQAGIQIAGGTLFVEVDGEPYEAGTVLPVGTRVTYRAVPDADQELTRWTGTNLTGEEIEVPVYATTNIAPVFEFGDLRVVLRPEMGGNPRIQLQRADGTWGNTNRTLFDDGEVIRIIGDGLRYFTFAEWRGDLAPLNANLDPANPRISPALTVGQEILDTDEIVVEMTAHFGVHDYVAIETEGTLNTDAIAYDFTEAGAPGTVPAAVMAEIIAAKHAAGLGGTVTFRNPTSFGPLVADPTVDMSTPTPLTFIEYDAEGQVVDHNLPQFLEIAVSIDARDEPIIVRSGPRNHIEAGGRGNLATAEGPGARSIGESLILAGHAFSPMDIAVSPGGRAPTSPPTVLGGATSWDLEFDAADRVVMAGLVYLNRNDWQHYNADGNVRLWADAVYDDGSTSILLSSPNLDQSVGEHNHFAGFSAPAGRYITNIRVWAQGGNNRAFTNVDDLVIIVEADEEETYTVDVTAEAAGSVTVSPEGPYTDGTVVSLTAVPEAGYRLGTWEYTDAPGAVIGTGSTLDIVVRSDLAITAVFVDDAFRLGLEGALGGNVTVIDAAAGRYASNWLGEFEVEEADLPWVYTHDHGWLYVFAAEEGAATAAMGWHYDMEVGFIYATEANYPNIWAAGDETWFHFYMEYNDPRLFYAFEDEDFIFVPRSGD